MAVVTISPNGIIKIDAPVKVKCDYVEVRIFSKRNHPLTALSDISEFDPEYGRKQVNHDRELFFPFCDIKVVKGLNMRFTFEQEKGEYAFNTGYCKHSEPVRHVVEIDSGRLLNWENDLFVSDAGNRPLSCYLIRRCYPVAHRIYLEMNLLSLWFEGTVRIVAIRSGKEEIIYSENVSCTPQNKNKCNDEISLKNDLYMIRNYLLRSWNRSSDEFISGGMYLFYDVAEKAYRAGHWNWTWGVVIEFALQYKKYIAEDSELFDLAKSLGEAMLRFQCPDDIGNNYLSGVSLGRWQNSFDAPGCVIGYYSIADSAFSCRWGIAGLYKLTGDERYLHYMEKLYDAVIRWMEDFNVVPSDYQDDLDDFTSFTLDETMFATGLFKVIYDIKGDEKYKTDCRRYIDSLIETLYLGSGCWARMYLQKEKHNTGFMNDTKGHGWAMDGLLCAYELTGDGKYLEMAVDTADFVGGFQNEDGSFNNFFACSETGGTGEKSTALWSWLFFRLYELTHDVRFSEKAEKALSFLRSILDHGNEDPYLEGALVACSAQSGIIYRPYFKMSCAYASAFMGLAGLKSICNKKSVTG